MFYEAKDSTGQMWEVKADRVEETGDTLTFYRGDRVALKLNHGVAWSQPSENRMKVMQAEADWWDADLAKQAADLPEVRA